MYKNKGVANQNDDCAFLSPTAIVMCIKVAILQSSLPILSLMERVLNFMRNNVLTTGVCSCLYLFGHSLYTPCRCAFLSCPQGPLNDNEVISYTHQILKGLVYLHDKKVIHRDLRSRNILISGEALCHPRY